MQQTNKDMSDDELFIYNLSQNTSNIIYNNKMINNLNVSKVRKTVTGFKPKVKTTQ